MTHSLWDLALLSILLLGMMTYAATRSMPLLGATKAVMMVCLPMLGASTFTAFGYTSNVGNIYFAVLMHGLSLTWLRYGSAEASRSGHLILFSLMIAFGSVLLLEDALVLSPIFAIRIRIVGASFISFSLVLTAFISLLDRCKGMHPMLCVPIVTVAVQALDSAIFFPCAFIGELPSAIILQFAVVGWLTKASIALLSVPFLAGFLRVMRHDLTPAG